MDVGQHLKVIEEIQISDNLKIDISLTFNEMEIFFDLSYMDGKFTIQKSFNNNYIGLEELAATKEEFNSEEKVRDYFNL